MSINVDDIRENTAFGRGKRDPKDVMDPSEVRAVMSDSEFSDYIKDVLRRFREEVAAMQKKIMRRPTKSPNNEEVEHEEVMICGSMYYVQRNRPQTRRMGDV